MKHNLRTSLGSILARFLPYDLYERHSVVIRLLRGLEVETVLDVGGRAGLLDRFAAYQVTALNVDDTGNIQYGGRAIPFRDSQFSAVVSIDTMEHLPRWERLGFLSECLRVAQKYLVVAAPFGSPAHTAREKELAERFLQVHGHSHVYLDEHVAFGLPSEEELEMLIEGLGQVRYRICYAGDFEWQAKHFEQVWIGQGQDDWRYRSRRALNHLQSLAWFHPVRLKESAYASANRFYLLVGKDG